MRLERLQGRAPRLRNGNRGLRLVIEADEHGFGLRNDMISTCQFIMDVHAFVAELPNVALHLKGIAQTHGPDIVNAVMGHQHADFGPIPRAIPHGLTPPVDARLLHVDDVFGVVHDAVRIHIAETDFRTVRGDLLHGAKVL